MNFSIPGEALAFFEVTILPTFRQFLLFHCQLFGRITSRAERSKTILYNENVLGQQIGCTVVFYLLPQLSLGYHIVIRRNYHVWVLFEIGKWIPIFVLSAVQRVTTVYIVSRRGKNNRNACKANSACITSDSIVCLVGVA